MTKSEQQELELVACELHDGLLQYVIGAHLTSESLRQRLRNRGETVPPEVETIAEYLKAAMAEGRRLIDELQPLELDAGQLAAHLERLVTEQAAAANATLQLDLNLPSLDQPSRCGMLYRIVQQAMQNIVRHSRATAIRVSANITGDSVMLELRDNGQGFDRDQVPAGHFGLRSMQRRAEILGGTCSIASQPGQGTVVQLEVPVRQ